jgi:hypothetical protein
MFNFNLSLEYINKRNSEIQTFFYLISFISDADPKLNSKIQKKVVKQAKQWGGPGYININIDKMAKHLNGVKDLEDVNLWHTEFNKALTPSSNIVYWGQFENVSLIINDAVAGSWESMIMRIEALDWRFDFQNSFIGQVLLILLAIHEKDELLIKDALERLVFAAQVDTDNSHITYFVLKFFVPAVCKTYLSDSNYPWQQRDVKSIDYNGKTFWYGPLVFRYFELNSKHDTLKTPIAQRTMQLDTSSLLNYIPTLQSRIKLNPNVKHGVSGTELISGGIGYGTKAAGELIGIALVAAINFTSKMLQKDDWVGFGCNNSHLYVKHSDKNPLPLFSFGYIISEDKSSFCTDNPEIMKIKNQLGFYNLANEVFYSASNKKTELPSGLSEAIIKAEK